MADIYHQVQALALAVFGAASSYIHRWLQGDTFVWVKFFATSFVGGFTGMLVYYLTLTIFPPNSPMIIFAVGASGAIGFDIVKPLWERFLEKKL